MKKLFFFILVLGLGSYGFYYYKKNLAPPKNYVFSNSVWYQDTWQKEIADSKLWQEYFKLRKEEKNPPHEFLRIKTNSFHADNRAKIHWNLAEVHGRKPETEKQVFEGKISFAHKKQFPYVVKRALDEAVETLWINRLNNHPNDLKIIDNFLVNGTEKENISALKILSGIKPETAIKVLASITGKYNNSKNYQIRFSALKLLFQLAAGEKGEAAEQLDKTMLKALFDTSPEIAKFAMHNIIRCSKNIINLLIAVMESENTDKKVITLNALVKFDDKPEKILSFLPALCKSNNSAMQATALSTYGYFLAKRGDKKIINFLSKFALNRKLNIKVRDAAWKSYLILHSPWHVRGQSVTVEFKTRYTNSRSSRRSRSRRITQTRSIGIISHNALNGFSVNGRKADIYKHKINHDISFSPNGILAHKSGTWLVKNGILNINHLKGRLKNTKVLYLRKNKNGVHAEWYISHEKQRKAKRYTKKSKIKR